jgi:protein disulfide-isomerase
MSAFAGKSVAAFLVALACATSAVAAPPADVWSQDVDAAWAEAKKSGHPLVLFITTDRCFFCDKMSKETCKNPAVMKELADGFVPVMVHTRTNLELVRRLGVQAFPTTVIVSKDAKIIAAMPGFLNVTQMRESLRVARVSHVEPAPRQ